MWASWKKKQVYRSGAIMYVTLVNSWRKHFRSTYYQDPRFNKNWKPWNQAMLKKHTWTSLYKADISNGFGAVRTLGLVLVFGSEGEIIKRDDPQHLTSSTIWWCDNLFQGCQLCGCGGFHASGMASISGENVASQPAGYCCHQQAFEVCVCVSVDGCWCGWGWETWSHIFLFLREEPLGFDGKWFDDNFQIQRKEKKTQSSLSRLQMCPLYIFGNKATDGTYRALIQGQIYKTALFLNFLSFRKTLQPGKYIFSFQEGLERFLQWTSGYGQTPSRHKKVGRDLEGEKLQGDCVRTRSILVLWTLHGLQIVPTWNEKPVFTFPCTKIYISIISKRTYSSLPLKKRSLHHYITVHFFFSGDTRPLINDADIIVWGSSQQRILPNFHGTLACEAENALDDFAVGTMVWRTQWKEAAGKVSP